MRMPCMGKNLSTKQEILSLNFSFFTEAQQTHSQTSENKNQDSFGQAWEGMGIFKPHLTF